MRAILIDPVKQEVSETEYSGEWKEIAPMIDAELFCIGTVFENGDTLFVDDEGRINGKDQHYFTFRANEELLLAGKGLILGCDEEGDSIGATISVGEIKDRIIWLGERNDLAL